MHHTLAMIGWRAVLWNGGQGIWACGSGRQIWRTSAHLDHHAGGRGRSGLDPEGSKTPNYIGVCVHISRSGTRLAVAPRPTPQEEEAGLQNSRHGTDSRAQNVQTSKCNRGAEHGSRRKQACASCLFAVALDLCCPRLDSGPGGKPWMHPLQAQHAA